MSGSSRRPSSSSPPAASPKVKAAILDAVDGHREEMELAAESSTYRSPGFPLVQALREHPELEAYDSTEAMALIEPVLRELWREQQLPYQAEMADDWYCGTCTPEGHSRLGDSQRVAWDGASCEHSRVGDRDGIWRAAIGQYDNFDKEKFSHPQEDFATQWDRWSPGALKAALWAVTNDPFWQDRGLFGDRRSAKNQGTQRQFLALCAQLSRTSERDGLGGVFFMSRRRWAEVLGVTEPVVGRWRGAAVRDGFLELIAPATHHGGPGARAAEYRWIAQWEPGKGKNGGRFKPRHEQATYAERLAAVSDGAAEWAQSLPEAPVEVEKKGRRRRAKGSARRATRGSTPSASVALPTPPTVTPSPPVSGSAPESAVRASRRPSGPDAPTGPLAGATPRKRELAKAESEAAKPEADPDNLLPGTVSASLGSALRLGLSRGISREAESASRIGVARGLRALEHAGESELPEPYSAPRPSTARAIAHGEKGASEDDRTGDEP